MEFADSHALSGEQCERLDRFESFVRQSVGEAHMERFVQTLQALSHAEKRRLAKELEMHAEDGKPCRRLNTFATQVQAAVLVRRQVLGCPALGPQAAVLMKSSSQCLRCASCHCIALR